jgi:hypothetical protein
MLLLLCLPQRMHIFIDMRYHFVRDIIVQGLVKIYKISTDDNPADMMRKYVPIAKFNIIR